MKAQGYGSDTAAIGVIGGLVGAVVLTRLMASLLFGVQPTDTGTLTIVIVTIFSRRVRCVLAAGLARIALGPERRVQRKLAASIGHPPHSRINGVATFTGRALRELECRGAAD